MCTLLRERCVILMCVGGENDVLILFAETDNQRVYIQNLTDELYSFYLKQTHI